MCLVTKTLLRGLKKQQYMLKPRANVKGTVSLGVWVGFIHMEDPWKPTEGLSTAPEHSRCLVNTGCAKRPQSPDMTCVGNHICSSSIPAPTPPAPAPAPDNANWVQVLLELDMNPRVAAQTREGRIRQDGIDSYVERRSSRCSLAANASRLSSQS